MAENAGSPEHLEELYRQAMLQQEEYSAQRRGGQEVSPAVQRPETQSPNHDELLLLDEVEQDGPTDERLPPEAWSSPQPWRERVSRSPATSRRRSSSVHRRARPQAAPARASSNSRGGSRAGTRPAWQKGQSPRSPFDDFIGSPPPVERRSRSRSAPRARSREGRYDRPTASTWLKERPPSAKRERPQQQGSSLATPRGGGSGRGHAATSLREKVGLGSRRNDESVPVPLVGGFERAKMALEEQGARKKKDPACTFHPEIDQRSRMTADLSRSGELTERLHKDFEKTQDRLSKLRKQHERAKNKDPECTFAPTLSLRNGYKGKGERSADEAHRAEPRITKTKMQESAERLYSTHGQSQRDKAAKVRQRDEMIKKTGAEFSEASRFLVNSNWNVEKACTEYFKTRPRWGAGGTRISEEKKKTSADRLSEYKKRQFGKPKQAEKKGVAAAGFGCSVPSTRLHPSSARSSRSVRVSRLPADVEDRLHNVPQHRQTETRRASSTPRASSAPRATSTPRLSQSQRLTQTGLSAPRSPVAWSNGATQSGAQQSHPREREGVNAAEQSAQHVEWVATEQSLHQLVATAGLSTQSRKREGSLPATHSPQLHHDGEAGEAGGQDDSVTEDEVRKILKHFYDTNHPEFASSEKIDEFIRFYKERAENNGNPGQWQELLWAAYRGKGVDPRMGYRDSVVA